MASRYVSSAVGSAYDTYSHASNGRGLVVKETDSEGTTTFTMSHRLFFDSYVRTCAAAGTGYEQDGSADGSIFWCSYLDPRRGLVSIIARKDDTMTPEERDHAEMFYADPENAAHDVDCDCNECASWAKREYHYERGRLDGIALAINDLDEAKEEWDEHHSKLEWQRGLAEGRYTHPRAMTTSPDDGLPF